MSKQILQNIIFPTDSQIEDNWNLFYKGTRGVILDGELKLSLYANSNFYTYLNGFSNRKWKKYTKIQNVTLVLDITGSCEIEYAAYSMPMYTAEKSIFSVVKKEQESREIITFTFPKTDEQLLGFEIHCFGACTVHGGYYCTDIEDQLLNHVELSIATTTCRKESFIKHNISILNHELLEKTKTDIKDHLWVHIVDNGRTLSRSDFPKSKHIVLHPNKNVGGSGGFARGMIESLQQTPKITNVLMMDDDVLILPDSIYRTYMLLRLIKDEHKESFINGSMLYYEEKNRQHEDTGNVFKNAKFGAKKPLFNFENLPEVLDNEKYYPPLENEYGAWWYCCIPISLIKKFGLPLPLFIRVDDVEYGLRCHPKIITMNSICIWHMGFVAKNNASFDLYQVVRNMFIAQSTSGVLSNVDLLTDYRHRLRMELLRFNYPAAELLLRAMEDYLKGPDFIKQDLGEQIVKENASKNEVLRPLQEITDKFVSLGTVFEDKSRTRLQRFIYGLTYNGQRFLPENMLKSDFVEIPFNGAYCPAKMFLHKNLLAVNPSNRTGIMRTMDKKKFKELRAHEKAVMRQYKQNSNRIAIEYRAAYEELTSVEFWKKYLEI